MKQDDGAGRVSGVIAGSILLSIGGLFLLQNMGLVRAGSIGDYWPMLLVWMGLAKILAPRGRRPRHFAGGIVLLVLGVFFQLDRLGVELIRARDFWPVLLVVAGVALIAESFWSRRRYREIGS
jgi:hypothetical protein